MLLKSAKPGTQLDGGNLNNIHRIRGSTNTIFECSSGLITDQVLEFPAPNPIVLVEWVLVSQGLQAKDLFLLCEYLDRRIIKDGLHCLRLVSNFAIRIHRS